jgi:Tfp pilus assembly protein PilO
MKFHSTKILILIIICNIAAIAGYYLLFQYIKTQTEAASSLTSTLSLSEQKNSHLNSLRSVVKDTEGKRQQLAAFLLSSDGEISFIEQVETLAKSSGLNEKTNNVSSIAGSTVSTKIFQMQIETTGSWSNLMYFLNQLENLPYNVRVQNVSLNKQSGDSKSSGSPWTAIVDINVTESI